MSAPNIETSTNPDVLAGGEMGVKVANAATETVGFYGSVGVALQTGVAVDAAGIHAALVALGLITA